VVLFEEGKRTNPWSAQVSLQGKTRHLGYFATKEEAQSAAEEAMDSGSLGGSVEDNAGNDTNEEPTAPLEQEKEKDDKGLSKAENNDKGGKRAKRKTVKKARPKPPEDPSLTNSTNKRPYKGV